MSVAPNAAEILNRHVELELECADRLYLNLYVPILQAPGGITYFWTEHRGYKFASSALMAPMTRAFVDKVERFVAREGIDVVAFRKGRRKDDIAHDYLAKFDAEEGVLFVGKAQEKTKVVRTERRYNPTTGAPYAWLVHSTAMVNQYYFYCVDKNFGPFFIKFSSYFPYNGRLCINGHEYLKRQLEKRGVAFEALDNGIRSCENEKLMQKLADELTPEKIDRFARKWFRKLPHPFPAADRAAGFRYDISILQAEFALTQIFDAPRTGRLFFEDIIRQNIDIGRPDHVQLIFNRRVTKRTKSLFRTRVITHGVIPSLHVDYKNSRIKQYHKEGRALRTETIINDTRDFDIGKRLKNLSSLRQFGLQTNRRLLSVQRISHDPAVGEAHFQQVHRPIVVDHQRASALRFDDPRSRALLAALCVFHLLPRGFTNRELRDHVAPLIGISVNDYTQGKMTYDLRRLRLRGLIERVPKSRRYRVTDLGFRIATFLTRAHARLIGPGLALLEPEPSFPRPLQRAMRQLTNAVEDIWRDAA